METGRHAAVGPAAGFVYQFERALNWLSQKEAGAMIGIETTDDVAVRDATGESVLEQDKYSLQNDSAPFGDRSKGLWNTIAIWMDAVESGAHPLVRTSFLMVTNTIVRPCIARQIALAKNPAEIDACVANLLAASKDPPKHLAKIMERVLRSGSTAMLRGVIGNCDLLDGSSQMGFEALRNSTLAHLQLPSWCQELAASIIDELRGWLISTVMLQWQEHQQGWVQRDHFVNQLHAILHARKRQISRERAECLIPVADEQVGGERGRPFVKQLYFICDDDSVVDTAIREFLRCNIEKSRLSKEGNITDEDWTAFEKTLISRWQKIRARVLRMKVGNPEEDIGYEIFTESTEDHRERLAGSETDHVYLTSGTYHRLADLLTVGWHPKYQDLIQKVLRSG